MGGSGRSQYSGLGDVQGRSAHTETGDTRKGAGRSQVPLGHANLEDVWKLAEMRLVRERQDGDSEVGSSSGPNSHYQD